MVIEGMQASASWGRRLLQKRLCGDVRHFDVGLNAEFGIGAARSVKGRLARSQRVGNETFMVILEGFGDAEGRLGGQNQMEIKQCQINAAFPAQWSENGVPFASWWGG